MAEQPTEQSPEKLSEESQAIASTEPTAAATQETAESTMKQKLRDSQTGTGTIAEALGRRNFLWAIFWVGILAVGALGEQIKTRWEYAQQQGKSRQLAEIPEGDRKEIVTASGLHYIDIKPGAGTTPQLGDLCLVDYQLSLDDGTKVISSRDAGQKAIAFILGSQNQSREFIPPGFEEGIATMQVGGKRQLIVPPQLGFGDEPRFFPNAKVEPGSTLVYEVELARVSIPPS